MKNIQLSFAPMEGITTFVFRNAFEKYYGHIDRYYAPFLANKSLSNKEIRDIHPDNNHVPVLIPQILTNVSETFLSISKELQEYGYPEVNLNLGCPSGTVVAKKRGAGQLKDPQALEAFLTEIFDSCPLEISVKTRIGLETEDEWGPLLDVFAKFPIKELIVHPRLQKDFYKGTPSQAAYEKAVHTLSLPLGYNGNITSVATFAGLLERFPGTEHVMMGRGLLQDPDLAGEIKNWLQADELSQTDWLQEKNTPSPKKKLSTFENFHGEILEGYRQYMSGDMPVLFHMKELWTYFALYFQLTEKEMKPLRKCNNLRDYQMIIKKILYD